MDIVSKINGNTLSATEFNQIPTELEDVQTSSGQTSSDAVLNQVSIGISRYAANNFYIDNSNSENTYVLTLAASMRNPVSSTVGYFVGMTIRFRAANANTGASTVNVNGAGVKNLKKEDGTTDLVAGDIPTTQDSIFRYNGTVFVLESGSASTTAKGIVELATNAEVAAGTDSTRAIVPSALAALFGTSSRSANGYARIPVIVGGAFVEIIFQWGTNNISSSGTVVSLPLAYPNSNAIVLGNGDFAGITMVAQSRTNSNFTGYKSGTGSNVCSWFSIGY